jgi:hypothetical protein
MSKHIPDSFASIVESVEAICAEFDSKEDFRLLEPARWIRDVNVADDDILHVAFLLDTDARLLAAYVILRLPNASRFGESLAKALARANYGLLPGCFEIDLDTGETRYRSTLNLVSDEITTREVAQLLRDALMMARTYAPAFQKIVESGADPLQAIDEIESE